MLWHKQADKLTFHCRPRRCRSHSQFPARRETDGGVSVRTLQIKHRLAAVHARLRTCDSSLLPTLPTSRCCDPHMRLKAAIFFFSCKLVTFSPPDHHRLFRCLCPSPGFQLTRVGKSQNVAANVSKMSTDCDK